MSRILLMLVQILFSTQLNAQNEDLLFNPIEVKVFAKDTFSFRKDGIGLKGPIYTLQVTGKSSKPLFVNSPYCIDFFRCTYGQETDIIIEIQKMNSNGKYECFDASMTDCNVPIPISGNLEKVYIREGEEKLYDIIIYRRNEFTKETKIRFKAIFHYFDSNSKRLSAFTDWTYFEF